MTNAEWLDEVVPEVSTGVKNAIMALREVTPTAGYAGGKAIELAEADLYMRMLILPELQEGSLSIKYSTSSLKAAANRIYKKHGDARYDDGQPHIQRVKL